jgi:anti-sigma factor RsiW
MRFQASSSHLRHRADTMTAISAIRLAVGSEYFDGDRRRIDKMTSLRGLGPPGESGLYWGDNHRYAMWDAAYVLGSLPAADRREFEAHMAGCAACREAVTELGGMPALLSQLGRSEVAAINEAGHTSGSQKISPESLPALLTVVSSCRRRTRLMTWACAAAAAIGLAVGVVGGQSVASPPLRASVSALPMAQVGTTVLASKVLLSRQQWGTYIALNFACMAPMYAHHDTVAMVVLGRDGSQTRLATWVAIPGDTATPAGSIALAVNQIAAVQVVLANNGQVMLERSA